MNTEQALRINFSNMGEAQKILRIINHKLKQKILLHILENPDIIAGDIHRHFGIEQSTSSQILSDLRRAGAVITKRSTKYIHYSVNVKALNEINRLAGLIKTTAASSQ
jgi:DNA-binding transcriptional ArsR family regulator